MTNQIANILEPWHDLTGKVVFVTGASSGIGKELCLDLARAGCKVIGCARRIDILTLLCDEINGPECEKDGIRAFALQLDVSADEDTIKAGQTRNTLEYEEKDWNYLYRLNLTGSWLVAKHVCLHMRNAKQGGSVINISSITGASSGIGKELCLDLARAGCKVIGCARRIDILTLLCDEINGPECEKDGIRAFALQLDVSADEDTIKAGVDKAWGVFGRIDALINNAGISGQTRNTLEYEEKDWNYLYRLNLTGSWLVAKHVCLHMRNAKQGGSVINISSITGTNRVYTHGGIAYASSKAAVNTMTKVMAMELGTNNIRVNSISPGIFRTEITQGLVDKDWFNNVTLKTIPLKTLGTINPALTSVARYLIHDSSVYVTGSDFIVDAGTTLPTVPIFSSL
nr:glucose/ribitol dehydrogenase [Tanacetum cinerariifolium]